mgnify:CR=1 FL=1
MRHIISVLLENEAGALARVVGLFAARGYNIETLNVAPTEDPTLSRMTVVTIGSDAHAPKRIAADFDLAYSILKKCGFRYHAVFRKRKPCFELL